MDKPVLLFVPIFFVPLPSTKRISSAIRANLEAAFYVNILQLIRSQLKEIAEYYNY